MPDPRHLRRRRWQRRVLAALVGFLVLVLGLGVVADPVSAQPAPPSTVPPAPSPPEPDDPGGDLPGFPSPSGIIGGLAAQLGQQIHEVINAWFRNAIAHTVTPVLELLSHSLLATPDLTAQGSTTRELWWTSLGLANTAYVLLIVIGGVVVMTHQSLQTRYALKDIGPRLVVGLVAANLSLLVCGWAIQLANALSTAFLTPDIQPPAVQVTNILTEIVLAPLTGTGPVGLSLLVGVILILALALTVTAIVRVVVTILLVVVAPLALACHALPHTDGVARWWWRGLAAVFGVQVAQALTLAVAVRVLLGSDPPLSLLGLPQADLTGLVVSGALLWVLLRIPVWATRAVFSPRSSVLVRLAKTVVLSRALGALRRS